MALTDDDRDGLIPPRPAYGLAVKPQPRPCAVVVVGSITVDVTAVTPRRPGPGETVLGRGLTMVPGGKGANQAVAAARAGAPTRLVGCVGDDLFRDLVLDGLGAEGVNISAVATVAGPTGVAHIRVDASGENDIVMVPLANDALTPERVQATLELGGAAVLLLQLEIPTATAVLAARLGHERGLLVVLDPAPAPTEALDEQVWAWVDVVTPNETEAAVLTGVPVVDAASAAVAGRWFLDRGVRTAVVTMAAQGACVVTAAGAVLYPPFDVEVRDSTAAGDAFAGHLGASLASGIPWGAALERAMAGGALAVTVAGASPSLPTAAAVDELLRRTRNRPAPLALPQPPPGQ